MTCDADCCCCRRLSHYRAILLVEKKKNVLDEAIAEYMSAKNETKYENYSDKAK